MNVGETPSIVRFDKVTKRFDQGALALDGVDLTMDRGEIVAMLGLSGSGKSTLLRHVNGLHRPTAGNVTVLGVDVGSTTGRDLRALRRRIGMVFQQFQLVGRLTVLENVCAGALGALVGPRLGLVTYPRAVRHRALEHLERVGLADVVFQRADTLSGGQQQRVAIARALIQRPEILLADEPVASLDPESAHVVMDLIRTIAADEGLTVLCSLHQVELALSWADRIVGLRDGTVVLRSAAHRLDAAAAMAIYERVGGPVPATSATS